MKAKVTVQCVLRQYKLMVQWDLGRKKRLPGAGEDSIHKHGTAVLVERSLESTWLTITF